MKGWLMAGLGLLGCVGQLRAQPASWRPAETNLAHPRGPLGASAPAGEFSERNLATHVRSAWLAATAEPAMADSGALTASVARAGYGIAVAVEPVATARRPVPGFLQIQVAGVADEITIRLLNRQGRVVRRQRSRSPVRLAISSLTPGRYFLLATNAADQLLADCQCIVIGL